MMKMRMITMTRTIKIRIRNKSKIRSRTMSRITTKKRYGFVNFGEKGDESG